MNEIYLTNETSGITPAEVEKCMDELLAQYPDLKKVLIIPPDFTRCYSYAGELTQILYKKLSPTATVHVMPALAPTWQWTQRRRKRCSAMSCLRKHF